MLKICPLGQCFQTLFLETHQHFGTFWMSPLSDQYISGPGASTNEWSQMCLIRKNWKMCSVGVPPGTGLGNCLRLHTQARGIIRHILSSSKGYKNSTGLNFTLTFNLSTSVSDFFFFCLVLNLILTCHVMSIISLNCYWPQNPHPAELCDHLITIKM